MLEDLTTLSGLMPEKPFIVAIAISVLLIGGGVLTKYGQHQNTNF